MNYFMLSLFFLRRASTNSVMWGYNKGQEPRGSFCDHRYGDGPNYEALCISERVELYPATKKKSQRDFKKRWHDICILKAVYRGR